MYKYPYTDDPEPKARPEDLEDKIIRHGGRVINVLLGAAGAVILFLLIYGIIARSNAGKEAQLPAVQVTAFHMTDQ